MNSILFLFTSLVVLTSHLEQVQAQALQKSDIYGRWNLKTVICQDSKKSQVITFNWAELGEYGQIDISEDQLSLEFNWVTDEPCFVRFVGVPQFLANTFEISQFRVDRLSCHSDLKEGQQMEPSQIKTTLATNHNGQPQLIMADQFSSCSDGSHQLFVFERPDAIN